MKMQNQKQETIIKKLNNELTKSHDSLNQILNSKSWTYISKIRNLYNKFKRGRGTNYFNKIKWNY